MSFMRSIIPSAFILAASTHLTACSGCGDSGLSGDAHAEPDAALDATDDPEAAEDPPPGDSHTWVMTLGATPNEQGLFLTPAPDGGIVAVGSTADLDAGYPALWVVKLDATGTIVWQTALRHAYAGDARISGTADGGTLLACTSAGTLVEAPGDFMLTKIGADGVPLWQWTVGDDGHADTPTDAIETSDGSIVAVGWTQSFGITPYAGWAVKISAAGELLWQKAMGTDAPSQLNGVIEDASGNLILVGVKSTSPSYDDAWIVSLSPDGATVNWQKLIGGTSSSEGATHAALTSDGSIMVSGYTPTASMEGSILVMKLTGAGDLTWTRMIPVGGSIAQGHLLAVTHDGGVILPGYEATGSMIDGLLVKLDGDGEVAWRVYVGAEGSDRLAHVTETTDHHVAAIGYSQSFGLETEELLLARLDATGGLDVSCGPHGPSAMSVHEPALAAEDATATIQDTTATIQEHTPSYYSTDCVPVIRCPE